MASYTEKFLQTPHHPEIKEILKNDGLFNRPVVLVISKQLHLARPMLYGIIGAAVDAGKKWAEQFLPSNLKTAQAIKLDINRHVDKVVREIGDRSTKLLLGPAASKVTKSSLTDHGKIIVRQRAVEAYIRSALELWKSKGIEHCKRVELDDVKTCPVCVSLNSKEYDIDKLLATDNPLTHDTHSNCRGAFVPIINDISKVYAAFNPEPVTFNLNTKNVELVDAPIEYKPWLEQFFKRVTAPFRIIFDAALGPDYKQTKTELRIKPSALHDEDPREIITAAMAQTVPASVVKQTMKDYRNMMTLGLVVPPYHTEDDNELFRELYQQYLLNQLDDLYEVVYFKTFFDGTVYGKRR